MLLDCVVTWKRRFRASKFVAAVDPFIPKPATQSPALSLLKRWALRASAIPKIRSLHKWLEKEKWLCVSGMIRHWKSEALDEYFEDEWQWAGVFQDILPITKIIAKDRIGAKGNIRVCYHCQLGPRRLEWIPAPTITSAGGKGHDMMKAFNKTLRAQTRIPISPSAQSTLGTPSRISASILKITKLIGGNISISAPNVGADFSAKQADEAREQAGIAAQRAAFCISPSRRSPAGTSPSASGLGARETVSHRVVSSKPVSAGVLRSD